MVSFSAFLVILLTRPNDLHNTTVDNNSIRREAKLVLIDHYQSIQQFNDLSDDDSFCNSSLGSK